jgi:tRNA(fMet)-specific endonuclease VapC
MIFLPDTNACISLLRQPNPTLIARWKSNQATDIALCSVVVYELRYGAERSSNAAREHAKLDVFLDAFVSLPFDDLCARRCAVVRAKLERDGQSIGPHDLQIAATALGITV